MPRERGSTAAGISDLPRIAGGINENGGNDMTKEEIVKSLWTHQADMLASHVAGV